MRKLRNKFTLIELIVSLAVFSILAALVMQFFSGAQRLWIASERRSSAAAEARASMEVINELLSSLVFCEGATPNYNGFFRLDNTAGESRLFFMTKSKMPLPQAASGPKNDIRFVGILRGADNSAADRYNPLYRLYLTIFCDCGDCTPAGLYAGLFTPYGVYTGVDLRDDAARQLTGKLSDDDSTALSGKLTPAAAAATHRPVLMERVIDFTVTAFDQNGTLIAAGTSDTAEPPAMLQIQITQMDTADDLEKWLGMTDGTPKDDFKQEHSRVFTRAFYLGSRQ